MMLNSLLFVIMNIFYDYFIDYLSLLQKFIQFSNRIRKKYSMEHQTQFSVELDEYNLVFKVMNNKLQITGYNRQTYKKDQPEEFNIKILYGCYQKNQMNFDDFPQIDTVQKFAQVIFSNLKNLTFKKQNLKLCLDIEQKFIELSLEVYNQNKEQNINQLKFGLLRQVQNPKNNPYCAVVKIITFRNDQSTFFQDRIMTIASGVLISKTKIMTVAHAFFNRLNKLKYTRAQVYIQTSSSVEKFQIKNVLFPFQYEELEGQKQQNYKDSKLNKKLQKFKLSDQDALCYDFAHVQIEQNDSIQENQILPIAWEFEKQSFQVIGFPCIKSKTEKFVFSIENAKNLKLFHVICEKSIIKQKCYLTYDGKTYEGMSGGPIVINKNGVNYTIGLHQASQGKFGRGILFGYKQNVYQILTKINLPKNILTKNMQKSDFYQVKIQARLEDLQVKEKIYLSYIKGVQEEKKKLQTQNQKLKKKLEQLQKSKQEIQNYHKSKSPVNKKSVNNSKSPIKNKSVNDSKSPLKNKFVNNSKSPKNNKSEINLKKTPIKKKSQNSYSLSPSNKKSVHSSKSPINSSKSPVKKRPLNNSKSPVNNKSASNLKKTPIKQKGQNSCSESPVKFKSVNNIRQTPPKNPLKKSYQLKKQTKQIVIKSNNKEEKQNNLQIKPAQRNKDKKDQQFDIQIKNKQKGSYSQQLKQQKQKRDINDQQNFHVLNNTLKSLASLQKNIYLQKQKVVLQEQQAFKKSQAMSKFGQYDVIIDRVNWFRLHNKNIQLTDVKILVCGNWKHIHVLNLTKNSIQNEGLELLMKTKWPYLKELWLSYNQISIIQTLALLNVSSLTKLKLQGNKLDNGSAMFLKSKSWNSLNFLSISFKNEECQYCWKTMTDNGWKQFKKLKILHVYELDNLSIKIKQKLSQWWRQRSPYRQLKWFSKLGDNNPKGIGEIYPR